MIPVRGLPTNGTTNKTHHDNSSSQKSELGSGWDRFNGKRTPMEMDSLRHQFKELMLNDTVNQDTSSEQDEGKSERIKGIIRRIWNEVNPDKPDSETPSEIRKKNFKGLIVELWSECFPDEQMISKRPVHTEEEPISMSIYERYRQDPF